MWLELRLDRLPDAFDPPMLVIRRPLRDASQCPRLRTLERPILIDADAGLHSHPLPLLAGARVAHNW